MQGAERRKGKGPTSRHVPEEDTMGTISNLSQRVNEAMTTAYRAELARRPQAIEEAKRVYLALVNPAALADGADASEGALAAVAASLTEYLLFDADIEGGRGALGAYAAEDGADPDAARLCLGLADTVFFSKFLVESQDPDAGSAVLVDLADGAKYVVADAEVTSTEGWSRGTLGVWLAKASGQWLCEVPVAAARYDDQGCGAVGIDERLRKVRAKVALCERYRVGCEARPVGDDGLHPGICEEMSNETRGDCFWLPRRDARDHGRPSPDGDVHKDRYRVVRVRGGRLNSHSGMPAVREVDVARLEAYVHGHGTPASLQMYGFFSRTLFDLIF
ncbi:MAG: hypothetical protein UHI81_03540 [Olegusella sp.]|nr:hypothetical protein [Olegusella sp.]